MSQKPESASKLILCKKAKFTNGGGDSATYWIECRLHKKTTDPEKCLNCPDRKPTRYNPAEDEKQYSGLLEE